MDDANYKIVFAGPVGAGKTTAIAALSDVPPVSTDEAATDMTTTRKPKTTVALDYGIMKLADGQRIHLYGTPGQERFDFMWDILVQGGIGLVLLIDASRNAPQQDMRFFLDAFRDFVARTGVAIGITRTDLAPAFAVEDLAPVLAELGMNPPVFTVDARSRADVQTLVKALLYSLDPELPDHAAA
ncbi:MAG: ATP/GTP-binding protein [Burkholderiales bacterium]